MTVSVSRIKNKMDEGSVKEALSLIEEVEREGCICPAILVLKGWCIQLDDQPTDYELSDAEISFKRALEIDEGYIPAMVELAWFYLNVMDDAEQASSLFERAVSLYREALTEAVVGKAKSLLESEPKNAARSYLAEITSSALNMSEIAKVLEEVESFNE